MLTWTQKLARNKELVRKGAAALWERARLLVEVYEDAEFLSDCRQHRTNPEDRLDSELSDTGYWTFAAIRKVFKAYPKRKQWEDRAPVKLLADILTAEAEERRRQQAEDDKPITRNRVSQKDLETVQNQLAVSKAREDSIREELSRQTQTHRSELEMLQEENEQLREENAELQRKLERANGRIEELELLLDRQHASV